MTTSPPRVPLSIYVLFHRDSIAGRELAHALHAWFRLQDDDGDQSEAGLPIWFRTRLSTDLRRAGAVEAKLLGGPSISPEIKWDEADRNCIVILGDHHMVADPQWHAALSALHHESKTKSCLLIPVAIHDSFYRLRFLTTEINALRIGPSLKAPADTNPQSEQWQAVLRPRIQPLRQGVTDAIARDFRPPGLPAGVPPRLQTFISHAKRDGLQAAEAIRSSLLKRGQLDVWFDSHDLAIGYGWRDQITQAARSGTCALIAVLSDQYASRPWCRAEISAARTPTLRRAEANFSLFVTQPTLVVQSPGASWSRAIPQLVHVPSIAQGSQPNKDEDLADLVVDRMLLEVLLHRFYEERAQLSAKGSRPGQNQHVAFLNFVPDSWTLRHVIQTLFGPPIAHGSNAPALLSPAIESVIIAHPGHGLRERDKRELEDLIEAFRSSIRHFGGQPPTMELCAQEALQRRLNSQPLPSKPAAPSRVLCLSASGVDDELEFHGLGMPHINDFLVRLTRRLLAQGHRILYGGTLNNFKTNLTQSLLEAAQGWVRQQEEATAATPQAASSAPLVNFMAWPDSETVPLELRADLMGIVEFRGVYLDFDETGLPDDAELVGETYRACLYAETLRAMRWFSSEQPNYPIRLLIGGRIADARGWMPGIAEEFNQALQNRQLPIVLGGLGGCAGLLADYLDSMQRPWPVELTFEGRRNDTNLAFLTPSDDLIAHAERYYAELKRCAEEFRHKLHAGNDSDEFWRGIPRSKLLDLLSMKNHTLIIETIASLLEGDVVPPKN